MQLDPKPTQSFQASLPPYIRAALQYAFDQGRLAEMYHGNRQSDEEATVVAAMQASIEMDVDVVLRTCALLDGYRASAVEITVPDTIPDWL